MFRHVKQLQYTVRVSEPNPGLANLLLEQFGGPQGELAALRANWRPPAATSRKV
ncbi:manganese catalase family protein [Salmonella enterica]|nr:manganese catalase family protein [Salmonella enterica]